VLVTKWLSCAYHLYNEIGKSCMTCAYHLCAGIMTALHDRLVTLYMPGSVTWPSAFPTLHAHLEPMSVVLLMLLGLQQAVTLPHLQQDFSC
jgi:hypothetical protein